MNDVSDELLRDTNALLGELTLYFVTFDSHRAVAINNIYNRLRTVEKQRPTFDKSIGAVRIPE